MTLAQFKRILRDTHKQHHEANGLTRQQKWEIRWAVCDNLLAEYRITQQQHKAWTEAY